MLNVSEIQPLRKCIHEILNKFPKLLGIYQFGSSLEYDLKDCGDIDLAVLLNEKVSEIEWWEFQNDLSLLVKKNIDLIQLRNVSTTFQNQIFSTAKRIYSVNDSLCDDYEALILSLYQKLNEERADILEELKITRKVYDI